MACLNHIRNILFDLDGTLVDSGETILASVLHALGRLDIDPDSGPDVESLIGVPLLDIFVGEYGMPDGQAHRAIDIYRDHYEQLNQAGTKVYDGVREGLHHLQKHGYGLYIATVKPTSIAEKVLQDLDLRQHFSGVAGASMGPERRGKAGIITHALGKFDLDAGRSMMVGDRDQDVNGARHNGLVSVAVTYGFGQSEELLGAAPDHTVDGFAEIVSLVLETG